MTRRQIEGILYISVVAPVYNEVAILPSFVSEIQQALEVLSPRVSYEVVLVNDGSTDGSGQLLDEIATHFPGSIKVVHLCRNFGHSSAIAAGLDHACGDAVILMDSDLQDNPSAFQSFFGRWCEGYDVVYAIRTSRQESTPVRFAIASFYRLLKWISDTQIPCNAGIFSLMDRRVVDVLRTMPERNRYFPGLRAWAGFRQTGIAVPRRARHDQRSRVGIRGLWKLSMNAVFSFSYFPIFILRTGGMIVLLCCLVMVLFVLYHKIITGKAVATWTSQMLSILFFGGVNLFGIGVIGEYVARIYDELKARPIYVIDRITETIPVATSQPVMPYNYRRINHGENPSCSAPSE